MPSIAAREASNVQQEWEQNSCDYTSYLIWLYLEHDITKLFSSNASTKNWSKEVPMWTRVKRKISCDTRKKIKNKK